MITLVYMYLVCVCVYQSASFTYTLYCYSVLYTSDFNSVLNVQFYQVWVGIGVWYTHGDGPWTDGRSEDWKRRLMVMGGDGC